ncbi:uncharacterized protein LOC143022503 [Oratosquilla oratoria]|uniref:uncharacterized protein LOC143022503 n=1 Tax=Oratosquilla oratoria TaxID=337810 RepID=UPI003F77360A
MRPITSGIGSAPHRLAKRLAKPLSATLGTISDAHLRNSADLIERLKLIDFKKKKMVSFDIKSLYTNVSIEGAMNAMKRALTNISEDELPIKKKDYIELVSLCVNFGTFVFKEQEYVQHRGLAMGSPLSAVMASLYMETLEVDKFIRIIGRGSKWFRYVDDILVIMPEESNINNKLRMLNDVNEHIQFTVEMEMERKLPFLDTLIHREDSSAKFSVYRKPTNRDDIIHYLSRHSTRTKTGVIIGFYLRAIRICSDEFLSGEISYIIEAFRKLMYPSGLLHKLKNKAFMISIRSDKMNKEGDYLVVLYSKGAEVITNFLSTKGIHIAHAAGLRIRDIYLEDDLDEAPLPGLAETLAQELLPRRGYEELRAAGGSTLEKTSPPVRLQQEHEAQAQGLIQEGKDPQSLLKRSPRKPLLQRRTSPRGCI